MSTQGAGIQTVLNKELWTQFFVLYKNLPALWDMRNPLYKERDAKRKAYEVLVGKLREIEPNASRESVLRRINIFRTNYRRERARVIKGRFNGRYYKTKLWYYDLLQFLDTQEARKEKRKYVNLDGEKSILRKKSTIANMPYLNLSDMFQKVGNRSSDFDNDDMHLDYSSEDNISPSVPFEEDTEDGKNVIANIIANQSPLQYQIAFQNFSLQVNPTNCEAENTVKEKIDEKKEGDEKEKAVENDEFVYVNGSELNNTYSNSDAIIPVQYLTEKNVSLTIPIQTENTKTACAQKYNESGSQKIVPKKLLQAGNVRDTVGGGLSEEAEILAKSWAVQYDGLHDIQKVYARKAIADILFEGCLGNLGRGITPRNQSPTHT